METIVFIKNDCSLTIFNCFFSGFQLRFCGAGCYFKLKNCRAIDVGVSCLQLARGLQQNPTCIVADSCFCLLMCVLYNICVCICICLYVYIFYIVRTCLSQYLDFFHISIV